MREACWVHGEGAVLFLEIDVQIEDVGWYLVRAQARCDFAQSTFCLVAKARLLKSKRPPRRQRRQPGQPCVGHHYSLGVRTVEKIIIDRTVTGSKRVDVVLPPPEVKTGAPRIDRKSTRLNSSHL